MDNNEFIYCKNCGAQLDKNAFFCISCGTATANSQNIDPTADQTVQEDIDPNISKKDYINKYAPASIKKAIRNSAIWCYICGGITVVSALLINPFAILDGLAFIGLGLGVHLGKSKACAIIALVLSILEVVIALLATGMLSGWLWIIAGVSCVVSTNKADKCYKQFKWGAVSGNNGDFS